MEENSIVKYECGVIKRIGNQIGVTNKLLELARPQLIPYYKKNEGWGFCSPDKTIIIEPKYGDVCFFSDDIACVSLLSGETHIYMYGCINKRGETIIPHIYFGTSPFSKGLVRATQTNFKRGIIDLAGSTVLEFLYDEIEDVFEGYAVVRIGKKEGIIDKNGNLVIKPIYGNISKWIDGKFAVTLGSFYGRGGIINKEEKVIIPLTYTFVIFFGEFYNAFVGTESGTKSFLISKTGNNITPNGYDHIGNFSEGLASVSLDGKVGFINQLGNIVIPLIYTASTIYNKIQYEFSDGLADVQLNDKWGFIDKSGKTVIEFIFEETNMFSQGLARVKLQDKYGYINKQGNTIIPFIYDMAETFVEELARVGLKSKYGYIDKQGNRVIQCIYDFGTINPSKGNFRVELNNKQGLIDYLGNTILPCICDEIHPFSENLARVKINRKYGFIDKNGNSVIPFIYEKAQDFRNGLALASINSTNLMGYINKDGVQYWEYCD